jgi:hypothetical protein
MEDLMLARPTLELDHKDGFHFGPFTGRRPRVHGFDDHALGEEIELVHASLKNGRGASL